MSYSKIRTFFREQAVKVDPDFTEWRDALVFEDTENIPSTLLASRYHIEFGAMSSTPALDRTVQDQWPVIVTIFKNGANAPTNALDELMDKAFDLKTYCIDPQEITAFNDASEYCIEAIEVVSITPSALTTTNDNIVKIQIEFNVRLYFNNQLV